MSHGATWYAKRCRQTSRATVRPMAHKGMKFGIFLAPFHRLGENPTLAMNRDMELIEWLDWLGYDEVWIGEHHSAGWELIASPEIFIAAAAERTRHIMLGSGVTSLPYHHPFLVAQRFVQLDHMTRGRTMLGCGPGALVSDAYMMGIEPITQRPRMDEALDAIMLLLKGEEPVTLKTDWFELRQARLHLAPYTEPHFPIAVASVMTPSGVIAAGRHGLGVLSLGAGIPGGPEALANQWKIGEETAARHGKTLDRKNWKLVVNVHVADDDEEAMRQVKRAERHETITYFEETLGRPPGRSDDPLTDGVKMGTTLVGSVETVIKGIEKLWQLSNGGFGGVLFRAHNWATREQTLHSYELFARYVIPRFQGSVETIRASNDWARGNRKTIFTANASTALRDRMPYVADGPDGPQWTSKNGASFGLVGGVGPSGQKYVPGAHYRADAMAATGLYEDGTRGIRRPTTPELRIQDMERDGVQAEVIFGILGAATRLDDHEAATEMCRIYNDWLVDFCRHYPDRHIGLACLPYGDIGGAVKELYRVAGLGLRGVELSCSWDMEPMWHPVWEPLWKAVNDVGLPLHFHTFPSLPPGKVDQQKGLTRRAAFFTGVSSFQMNLINIVAAVIGAAVLERYPDIRISFGESGIGWLPYALDRMDFEWEDRFRDLGLTMRPSDYWRRQCKATFQFDRIGTKLERGLALPAPVVAR